MRYPKLLFGTSPKKMNLDLENYYGYGLYEFCASLAVMESEFGEYDPYNNRELIIDFREFFEKEIKEIDSGCQNQINKIIKKYDQKYGPRKNYLSPDYFKIKRYTEDSFTSLPSELYELTPNELRKNIPLVTDLMYRKPTELFLKNLKHGLTMRDKVTGIWAGVMRYKTGIHWLNISELINWLYEKLPKIFGDIIGDPDENLIKKQFLRKRKRYETYFEVIKIICFPDKRKKPYWVLWFGENYILWVSPEFITKKRYEWLKDKHTKKIVATNSLTFFKNFYDIALNELKSFFQFYYENNFTKPPQIIFPQGKILL